VQQALQASYEPFDASQWRIGIVVAQFNRHITDRLLESALQRAAEYSIPPENIEVIKVAGAIEIPVALQHLAASGKYRALLGAGCIIQGETPHFDYVCKLVTEGILRVQLDHTIPVGFGVLTCNDEAQAEARARIGGDHLDAALQLAKSIEN
jgi:6,7-dimethyl-8-ribityllumazine synthase